MFAASDPNQLIGNLAVGGLVLALLWRLLVWVRDAPVKPDPWDAATEQKLSEPEAVEVCRHCSAEQPDDVWFCAHCGTAVGPYNNSMSYLNIFSQGEVLRNGVTGKFRPNLLTVVGYLVFSTAVYFFLHRFIGFYFSKISSDLEN